MRRGGVLIAVVLTVCAAGFVALQRDAQAEDERLTPGPAGYSETD